MKRSVALALVGVLLLGGLALPRGPAGEAAARDGTGIDWWVLAGAGGTSAADEIVVSDTMGQAIAGGSAYDAVALSAGFWYAGFGPTSVQLTSFEAVPLGAAILVTWETSQEIDTLGFNLYRAESEAGPMARLNEMLIPTQVPPGSPFGAAYEWLDEDGLVPGITYYYWLEDVDLHGQVGMHGPVYATAEGSRHVIYLPTVLK